MAVRSKFERQLNFREHGFSIKIPDVGRSLKPFDYVVGVPVKSCGKTVLRFVAIEAKIARGWTMNKSAILPHQAVALDMVERLAPFSSWIALGFLDIPKMKRGPSKEVLKKKRKKEAFLISWHHFNMLMGEKSIHYNDISNFGMNPAMEWKLCGKTYRWIIPQDHYFFDII